MSVTEFDAACLEWDRERSRRLSSRIMRGAACAFVVSALLAASVYIWKAVL